MSSGILNGEVTSTAWPEWTTRLQTYTDWLNVQLRKHPNNRSITDLRYDLQDGVVVAQLVEALGGERVIGIDPRPSSPASRKENVERIFQHFSTKQVPISYCKAKDVLAGDLKCIMRLIHAVASHYRPETVLSPAQSNLGQYHSRCATSAPNIAEGRGMSFSSPKNATLMARQKSDAAAPAKKMIGGSALPIRRQPLASRDCPKLTATISSLALEHRRNPFRKSYTSLSSERFPNAEKSNSTKDSPTRISCKVAPLQYTSGIIAPAVHSSSLSIYRLSKKKSPVSRSQPCSLDSVESNNAAAKQEEEEKGRTCSCSNLKHSDVEELLKQVQDAREQLQLLQKMMLLHGNGNKFLKDAENGMAYGSAEDVDIPRKSPIQKNAMNSGSKRVPEPMSMVCGERRLETEESFKSKIINKSSTLNNSENLKEENETLRRTIEEKEQEIRKLKASVSRQISRDIDKKMKYPFSIASRTQREELQVVHEALTSLRKCFPANDPYQHTLDTIEQSLSALLERVNSLEIGALPPQSPPLLSHKVPEAVPIPGHRGTYNNPDDSIRQPIPKISGFSIQRQEDPKRCTKVVYYMDKSVTPFRCILNKRIGEATLRDFKLLFDRPGQYRYHFKTLDPEFGMVKEEVLHDEDILPGWDGKIIVWIEEDCS